MLSHLRTEAYPVYGSALYPPAGAALSYEANNDRIDAAKAQFEALTRLSAHPRTPLVETKR